MSRTRGDGGRSKQLVEKMEKITKNMTSRTLMFSTKITKMFPSQMVPCLKSFSHREFAPTPIHLTMTPIKLRCKTYVCISDVKAVGVSLKAKNSKVVPLTSRVLLVLSLTQLREFCLFYQRIISQLISINSQSYRITLMSCHVKN